MIISSIPATPRVKLTHSHTRYSVTLDIEIEAKKNLSIDAAEQLHVWRTSDNGISPFIFHEEFRLVIKPFTLDICVLSKQIRFSRYALQGKQERREDDEN